MRHDSIYEFSNSYKIGINYAEAVSIFVLTHFPWIDIHSKNENQFELDRATVRRLLFDFGT